MDSLIGLRSSRLATTSTPPIGSPEASTTTPDAKGSNEGSGATAVRSIAGKPIPINKIRGKFLPLETGGRFTATIHPSYLLRIRDDADKRNQYRMFVRDLAACREALKKAA